MLMMVTRADDRLPAIVRAAVDGGVNIVQVRGSDDAPIRAAVGDRARVVVNGIDHLPERMPGRCIGRSVHSVEAALRAEAEGCEYVVAGTIFPSTSHPGGEVAGVNLIEEIAKQIAIPVLAIGGITPHNAKRCLNAGARGVAVLSFLMDAADPKAAAEELVAACS
jgi:thiazole tautomerase (transcriptional regulator TenI)